MRKFAVSLQQINSNETMDVKKMNKIPYGMSNFEDVILGNYYYVDKSEFIDKIEHSANFFFFIRPRRFGKSLFLSMLENYYDINKKDKFDALFGNLWIGENPTEQRNSYAVMKLNFSNVSSDPDDCEASFNNACNLQFSDFCNYYKNLLPEGTKELLLGNLSYFVTLV